MVYKADPTYPADILPYAPPSKKKKKKKKENPSPYIWLYTVLQYLNLGRS
jgi:hypothetical protein